MVRVREGRHAAQIENTQRDDGREVGMVRVREGRHAAQIENTQRDDGREVGMVRVREGRHAARKTSIGSIFISNHHVKGVKGTLRDYSGGLVATQQGREQGDRVCVTHNASRGRTPPTLH